MSRVKIGLVQMSVPSNKSATLEKAVRIVSKVAEKGAKIVCLQELFNTPYFPQSKKKSRELAETIQDPTIKKLKGLAKKLKLYLIAPIYQYTPPLSPPKVGGARGGYFNSAVVIGPNGRIVDTYQKIHIPHDPLFYERSHFSEGKSGYKVFKTKYGNFAVLICYDQWFPEAARQVALKGADLIFYPTAIGYIAGYKATEGDWHDAWETVQRSHAIANSVYVAAVNRVGKEGRLKFWGQSFVSDPFGNILKTASQSKDEVLVVEVDMAKGRKIRSKWGFFKNRRADTYVPA
jgi:agmatine deiminase